MSKKIDTQGEALKQALADVDRKKLERIAYEAMSCVAAVAQKVLLNHTVMAAICASNNDVVPKVQAATKVFSSRTKEDLETFTDVVKKALPDWYKEIRKNRKEDMSQFIAEQQEIFDCVRAFNAGGED